MKQLEWRRSRNSKEVELQLPLYPRPAVTEPAARHTDKLHGNVASCRRVRPWWAVAGSQDTRIGRGVDAWSLWRLQRQILIAALQRRPTDLVDVRRLGPVDLHVLEPQEKVKVVVHCLRNQGASGGEGQRGQQGGKEGRRDSDKGNGVRGMPSPSLTSSTNLSRGWADTRHTADAQPHA